MTKRNINLIVIHCSATTSGQPLQQGTPGKPGYLNATQVINAWHAERGFSRQADARRAFNWSLPSIGYHFVIDIDGKVMTGRSVDEVGAHAANYNAQSIGICLIGGVERDAQYTPAQWASLRDLVKSQAEQQTVPLSPPMRAKDGVGLAGGVCGHRDVSPDTNRDGKVTPGEWLKTCPGFDVAAWLERGLLPERKNVLVEGGAA